MQNILKLYKNKLVFLKHLISSYKFINIYII